MKKISMLILLILIIYSFSLAQSSKEPISFKISLIKILQSKKELLVKSTLTNISNDELVIDKKMIGRGSSFYTSNGFFTASNEIGSEYKGQYLVLLPKQSYEQVQSIKLDNDFFRTDGKYRVRLSYIQYLEQNFEEREIWRGMIKSNQILFYMRNGKISH